MKSLPKYSLSKIKRCRWNVFDLITTVARRTVPAYFLCEIDMQSVEQLRARLAANGIKVTVTAVLLKAIAIAQQTYPESRSFRLPWGRIVTLPTPVAGFTVERIVGTDPAVFFGTMTDPITRPLAEIARTLKSYAQLNIEEVPQLHREDLFRRMPWIVRQVLLWLALCCPALRRLVNPATFGLSTLGKFGLKSLLAPCVSTCIFGVGAVEERPVPVEDSIEVRPILTLSLSFDTMVLDLYKGAEFFHEVKRLIESGLAGHICETDFRHSDREPALIF